MNVKKSIFKRGFSLLIFPAGLIMLHIKALQISHLDQSSIRL